LHFTGVQSAAVKLSQSINAQPSPARHRNYCPARNSFSNGKFSRFLAQQGIPVRLALRSAADRPTRQAVFAFFFSIILHSSMRVPGRQR
jgi:hypothetical protein